MSETAAETELVRFLGRIFPSFAGLDAAEGLRRADSLGLYAASIWSAGQPALVSRGVHVPADVHAALAATAQAALQARRGGAAFLGQIRAAVQDAQFAPVMSAIATLYAQARAKNSSSGRQVALPDPGAAAPPPPAATAPPPPAATAPPPPAATAPPPILPPEYSPGPPTAKLTLREIAGFELVKLIGEGGMGKVFKARQRSLDRIVALKVLSPELAKDPDFVDRFHREAFAAAALHHNNIVGVIEHGRDDANGVHYIAFEFIEGMSVESMLKAKRKFPEREALATARAVASALVCAEKAGIVHRDIKPDNVIVGRDGIPRLVDLGLAKKQGDKTQMTIVGVVMGTPAYMAPEQALGETEIDHRADIYALGMTLYRLVTGQFAFDAESSTGILMKHITDVCPDPRTVEPTLSDGTASIILKLAAREKDQRYNSAADVLKDIELVLAGRPPSIAPLLGPGGAVLAGAPSPTTTRLGRSSGRMPALGAGPEPGTPPEPPWAREVYPASIAEAAPAPAEPIDDPAAAAIAAYERTGNGGRLTEAVTLLAARVKAGGPPRAVAAAEAMTGLAHLLRGEQSPAEAKARAALELDRRCTAAARVIVRAARKDGDRCKLAAGLAAIRETIVQGKLEDADKAAGRLAEQFPSEPHPLLVRATLARLAGNEDRFVDLVKAAWTRFPSTDRPDVGLAGLDGLVADTLAAHGRAAFRDPVLLRSTLEHLDDKSNLVAGSLRMAVAIAHAALLREPAPSLFDQRRLHFAMGRALAGLRWYEAALEEIVRATHLNPTETERAAHDIERSFIATAKERDAKAAVVLPQGKYKCLGLAALRDLEKARATVAAKERAALIAEIEKVGPDLAAACDKDPQAKNEVQRAALVVGPKNPLEQVEPLGLELAEIARDRARAASGTKAPVEKRGFFDKLKDAAAGVANAARDAQIKLREGQLKTKYDVAVKQLATLFAVQLRDFDYKCLALIPLMRKVAPLGCVAACWADEEARARKDVERLSELL